MNEINSDGIEKRWGPEGIFDAIEGERLYQDERRVKPQHSHSVTEYLVYMEHYINHAKAIVSTEDDEFGALDDLCKVAALAVAAMEDNGWVKRDGG